MSSGAVCLRCKISKSTIYAYDLVDYGAGLLYFTGYLFCVGVLLLLLGLQERVPDSPSPAPSLEDHRRPGSHPSSHRSSSVSSSPAHTESSSDRIRASRRTTRTLSFIGLFVCGQFLKHSAFLHPAAHHNGLSMNHALLGLSPNIPPGPKEGDLAHDMSHEAAAHKRNHTDKGEFVRFLSPLLCTSSRDVHMLKSLERHWFHGLDISTVRKKKKDQ